MFFKTRLSLSNLTQLMFERMNHENSAQASKSKCSTLKTSPLIIGCGEASMSFHHMTEHVFTVIQKKAKKINIRPEKQSYISSIFVNFAHFPEFFNSFSATIHFFSFFNFSLIFPDFYFPDSFCNILTLVYISISKWCIWNRAQTINVKFVNIPPMAAVR